MITSDTIFAIHNFVNSWKDGAFGIKPIEECLEYLNLDQEEELIDIAKEELKAYKQNHPDCNEGDFIQGYLCGALRILSRI